MTAKVVVVTGYVEIPGHPRSREVYDRLGGQLGRLRRAPVRVFLDELRDCWLEADLREHDHVEHEVADNPDKNSRAYHVVQHQKTAWLLKATETDPRADIFVWLDYGILHQPGVTLPLIEGFLRQVSRFGEREIAIPGAWPRSNGIASQPDWHFCGSTIVAHRDHVHAFHQRVRAVTLARLKHEGRVTWEINDWSRVESEGVLPIRWYPANHDHTQLINYC